MTNDHIRSLLGSMPFETPGDGSLVSANCRGYVLETRCDMCDESIDFILWFIVDAEKRPDLYEEIYAGTLHDAICPQCGHQNRIQSGLLLLRPTEDPALLYSPSEKENLSESKEHLKSLLGMLKKQMRDDWQQEWLSEGVISVERSQLPSALRHGKAAFRSQEIPNAKSLELLQELIVADQWTGTKDILLSHPELMEDTIMRLFEDTLERLRNHGDAMALAVFDEYRSLIKRCSEVGVEKAIDEKIQSSNNSSN